VYAEIRKSTLEPENNGPKNTVSNGATTSPAGNHVAPVKDEGIHCDSLQDMTLIDNYIYKNSAECAKPVRRSYVPGACS